VGSATIPSPMSGSSTGVPPGGTAPGASVAPGAPDPAAPGVVPTSSGSRAMTPCVGDASVAPQPITTLAPPTLIKSADKEVTSDNVRRVLFIEAPRCGRDASNSWYPQFFRP